MDADEASRDAASIFKEGQTVRVRFQDGARRASVIRPSEDGKRMYVTFHDDESEADVPLEALRPLQAWEAAIGIPPRSLEALKLRQEADALLLQAFDAQAALERYSAAIQCFSSFALSSEESDKKGARRNGEHHVVLLKKRTVWEGWARQSAEAGVCQVRFVRPLEGKHFQVADPDDAAIVHAPPEQSLPVEQVLAVSSGKLAEEQIKIYIGSARAWMALGGANQAIHDCNVAAALVRLQMPAPPKLSPGITITAPLFVLGIALAYAQQIYAAIFFVVAAGLADWYFRRSARIAASSSQLASVIALRGRAKLLQGLPSYGHKELRAAVAALGPLKGGKELKLLQTELRILRCGGRKALTEIKASREIRTWKNAAREKIKLDAFLQAQEDECRPGSSSLFESLAREDDSDKETFELGYMDYVGDGFEIM